MNQCPFCKQLNAVASILPPQGTNTFMLTAVNTEGSFEIPPNGIFVSVKGCNSCGSIFLGSSNIIGSEITHD